MQSAVVRILHPAPVPGSGPLGTALADARSANAARLAGLFRASGADDVGVDEGIPDGRTFGERLRSLVHGLDEDVGLVVLGSGSIPLARPGDVAALVEVARSGERRALANSFYSADVVAVGQAANLAAAPYLPSDNSLPRWLRDEGGYRVDDLRGRWRLAVDLDSPVDVLLAGVEPAPTADASLVLERLAGVRRVRADPRAELIVAGRTSAATLRWLERRTSSRTRALVEERGIRAIGVGGAGASGGGASGTRAGDAQRPPRSVLAMVLDDRGPEALGPILAELGEAAIVDTRVLLAHRLGAGEPAWPAAEDRYASDLLLPDAVHDAWLRALTASARDAAIPVLLGGHTLVGPGIRLLLARRR